MLKNALKFIRTISANRISRNYFKSGFRYITQDSAFDNFNELRVFETQNLKKNSIEEVGYLQQVTYEFMRFLEIKLYLAKLSVLQDKDALLCTKNHKQAKKSQYK